MNKTIINKQYLKQFIRNYETYYNTLNVVTDDVTCALYLGKELMFEKACDNNLIRDDLEAIVEHTWRITHDEDTVISVLQKFNCEVI